MPFLVHGIVEADADDALASTPLRDDGAIGLVHHAGLAAVVREVPDVEVLPSRANLLEHTRVLEELAGAGTTVLPMRFGTVVTDADALVADYLDPQREPLLTALDRLHGHVELRLRGQYDRDEVLRELVAGDRTVARLVGRDDLDARMQLGERIVAGLEVRRDLDSRRVVDALDPHVAGVVAAPVAEPLEAFSLSLLVPQAGTEAFDAALDEVGRGVAPSLRLELVGPVPPFSFTAVEEAP